MLLKLTGQRILQLLRVVPLLSVPGTMLANMLFKCIHSRLLQLQRPEEPGFMFPKATTERVLALRVLVERRHELQQGMFGVYVDVKKALEC